MQARPSLSEMLQNLQKVRMQAAQVPTPPAAVPAVPAVPASPVARLLELLREFAGFRPTPHLQRKLEKAFRGMSDAELARWVDRLAAGTDRQELTALVEDLTNHETYFFRDTPQLDLLATHVLPALVRQKARSADKTLRIWSAACSTGEEAWTLALMVLQALLDAGIARETRPGEVWLPPEWKLEVLGTDISRQAIRVARAGAYRTEALASFRSFPERFRRFFDDAPAVAGRPSYRHVRQSLRPFVRFELFNLVDKRPPCRDQDLVLCRNVLIYIDTELHGQVQCTLRDALRPGGHLMMGVVDRLQLRGDFHDRWFSRCVIHERK